MTLKSFQRTILKRLPAKWSRHKQAEEAFAACLESFDPAHIETACAKVETFGFPWALVIQLAIQILLWYLENRTAEKRGLFKRWQKEVKALNK